MQTFQTRQCLPHDLSFAPDGRRLVVGSPMHVLIDTLGSDPPEVLESPGGTFASHAQLALGGTALVYTVHSDLHVWSRVTRRVNVREGIARYIRGFTVSHDGTTLYAACITQNGSVWNTQIRVFDVATGRLKETFLAREGHFSWLAMSADGRRLVGRGSHDVCVWDLTAPHDPQAAVTLPVGVIGKHLAGVALSADGSQLAVITNRGLEVWAISGGTADEVFRSGKHKRRVTAVACSPTRQLIATGDTAGQVFLWDHTGRVLTRYDWGLGEVVALCFAPDGLRCACADGRGKVVVWDVDA